VLLQPRRVDRFGPFVRVGAVEEDETVLPGAVRQHALEIALRLARLGEDDRLLRRAQFLRLRERDVQRRQQRLALGVVLDRGGEPRELFEIRDLGFDRSAVVGRERRGRLVFVPLLRGLGQRLVVLAQRVFERVRGLALVELRSETPRDVRERACDRESGRGEQLAQHQRHQRSLAGRKRLEVGTPQVFRNEIVEPVFALLRRELLDEWVALREGDVGGDLAAQRAMADRSQPRLESLEDLLLAEVRELFSEAREVAETVIVDDADETKEFEQRVLERRRGQQQFMATVERALQRVRDHVVRLVDVAQPVGLVDHDEIPRRSRDVARLAARELVRADHDGVRRIEGSEHAALDRFVVGLRFEDPARQKELLAQFLVPLLAQVRGTMIRMRRFRSAQR